MNASTTTDGHLPKKVFELRMPLRWGDHDALDHVNNTMYLRYLEEARVRWFAEHIANWDRADDASPLMAAIHANYRRPLRWPADILVQLFCERLGNSSLTIGHRIVDANDPSILYLDGNVVMVWINPANGKPTALPEGIRTACA